MKYSGIGGQAVIEGVMMKGADRYAVSVRKPDGEIEVKVEKYKSIKDRYKAAGYPIIRGVVTFAEALVVGMGTLNYSAGFWEDEEDLKGDGKKQNDKIQEDKKQDDKKQDDKKNDLIVGVVVMLAVILAIGLFVLLPFFISELLSGVIPSAQIRGLIEGVIRVALFVGYVKAISFMEDIRRVFMYHGAEHKCINCIENGYELTVENAKKQTTVHKRCGTSFLLVVMFVSILFFMFISVSNIWLRMILRILLIPLIAGLAYEFILFAGKSESPVMDVLSRPGLWLQSLTTREPEDSMLEVAISSVEAVFDWRGFIEEAKKASQAEKTMKPAEETAASDEKGVAENTAAPDEKGVTNGTADAGFEQVDMDDEEDDEILKALDRYFEGPEDTRTDNGEASQ